MKDANYQNLSLLGWGWAGRLCPPNLFPKQRALCNHCPSVTPLTAWTSFKLPTLPSFSGRPVEHACSAQEAGISASPSVPPQVFPAPPITRASCNVGSCSQSRSPGPAIQRSWASTPYPLLSSAFCPLARVGEGLGSQQIMALPPYLLL